MLGIVVVKLGNASKSVLNLLALVRQSQNFIHQFVWQCLPVNLDVQRLEFRWPRCWLILLAVATSGTPFFRSVVQRDMKAAVRKALKMRYDKNGEVGCILPSFGAADQPLLDSHK
ncbi:hypothetical protein A6456_09330 [Paraburkholderia tropica]|nr:hypothetical protein A6456_09330 [Paraburkholderia tropica]